MSNYPAQRMFDTKKRVLDFLALHYPKDFSNADIHKKAGIDDHDSHKGGDNSGLTAEACARLADDGRVEDMTPAQPKEGANRVMRRYRFIPDAQPSLAFDPDLNRFVTLPRVPARELCYRVRFLLGENIPQDVEKILDELEKELRIPQSKKVVP